MVSSVTLILNAMRKLKPNGQTKLLNSLKTVKNSGAVSVKDMPDVLRCLDSKGVIEKNLINKSENLDDIALNITNTIKTKGLSGRHAAITNVKTGLKEPLVMDINCKVPKNGKHVDVEAYDLDGNVIGLVRLKADPNAQVRNIESLYIDFWATNPNYKGIGREMLRNIVKISNNSGFNGRVSLNACTGSVPSEFSKICGYSKKQDVSCAIKYKKMGFNSRLHYFLSLLLAIVYQNLSLILLNLIVLFYYLNCLL